jgi:hypothetical protein
MQQIPYLNGKSPYFRGIEPLQTQNGIAVQDNYGKAEKMVEKEGDHGLVKRAEKTTQNMWIIRKK